MSHSNSLLKTKLQVLIYGQHFPFISIATLLPIYLNCCWYSSSCLLEMKKPNALIILKPEGRSGLEESPCPFWPHSLPVILVSCLLLLVWMYLLPVDHHASQCYVSWKISHGIMEEFPRFIVIKVLAFTFKYLFT